MLTPEQLKELQAIEAKYAGLDPKDPNWDAKQNDWFGEWLDFALRVAPEDVLESLSGGSPSPESIEWEEEAYSYLPPMETLNKMLPNINMDSIYNDDEDDFDTSQMHSHHDTNGDGDDDLHVVDTSGDGKADTAVVTAGSKEEEKSATKKAKEKLGVDEKTSTGKSKKELEDKLFPKSSTAETVSDSRQKNILSALVDMKF